MLVVEYLIAISGKKDVLITKSRSLTLTSVMGSLLSLLYGEDSCRSAPKCDIFVDFENAAPNSDEVELYKEADSILEESKEMLNSISNYKGWFNIFQRSIA